MSALTSAGGLGAGDGAGEQREPAERVVGAGPEPAGVVVREELGLVGGHVDVDRAVALAAFAGQAQVQGVADGGRSASRR